MNRTKRLNSQTVFTIFLLAQVGLPLLSIVFFQRHWGYPAETIFYHEILVIAGYLVLVGLAFLLTRVRAVRTWPASRYILPLLWSGFSVALYFFHLFAWVGHLGTGMNLTVSMVTPYVLHPSSVFTTLPISPVEFWGALAGIPAAILLAYLVAAPSLSAALPRLLVRGAALRRRRFTVAQQSGVIGVWGALVFLAYLGFSSTPAPLSAGHLFGDPIFISLSDSNTLLPVGEPDPTSGTARDRHTAPAQSQKNPRTPLPVGEPGATSDTARDSYTVPAQFQKKNVILIVVDSLRADRLGWSGYARDDTPFLDSLRQGGDLRAVHMFYSASCCTFGGVLSLLRSQHWFKMTRRGFALQDVLKKAGYRTHFVLDGDLSNLQGIRSFYGDSVDTFSDGLSPERHFSLNDDRGVFESLDKIAASDGTPAFFYFHLMSVHSLGVRLPENARYVTAANPQDPFALYSDGYDNGVIQADGNIRALFARLQAKGYLQNSFVIITGDHGESIGERAFVGHGHNLYAEEVNPPLLIYDPDPVVYRNLDVASQIDVAPTILDRLGLPIPPSWDGHSLLRDEPPRFSYLRIANLYALIDHTSDRTLKYIYDDRKKTEQIYDETHDPHEEQDIFASTDARELQDLRAAIGAFAVHPGS